MSLNTSAVALPPKDLRSDKDAELMIDGLRGIAALAVLVTHAFDIGVADSFGMAYADTPPLWRLARASFGYGGFWVWCFFMISGLCIHQSIARSIASGGFSWKRYLVARVTRIYPLFLIGLLLAILAWFVVETREQVPSAFPWLKTVASIFQMQIFTSCMSTYQPSWSLSGEMAYYILWPAVLLMAGRSEQRAFVGSVVAALVVVFALLVLWHHSERLASSTVLGGLWIVAILYPVWLAGTWLAVHWQAVSSKVSLRLWRSSIALCVVSECLLAVLKYKSYPAWAIQWAGWSALPGLMLFIAGARHAALTSHPSVEKVCRWLGAFSYPCYVLHIQLVMMLDVSYTNLGHQGVLAFPMVRFALLLFPVLAVVAWVGPPLERFFMRWRSNFTSALHRRSTAVQ